MRFAVMYAAAAAATVFDACGNANAPPPSTSTSSLPWCYTDPPMGCAVLCTGDPTAAPVDNGCCNVAAADVRASQFLADVQNAEAQAEAMGDTLCELHPNVVVTPCSDGLPPVLWPNQDPTTCMAPPAGCTIGGCTP